ncbi:hypothetical protein [Salana multivorans]|uniref:hypothetical protein n=1 Tax=Salana multivorans TaxID=120377 RepID=UPI0024933099|nr:hypothetical protein [Salana multivorans]
MASKTSLISSSAHRVGRVDRAQDEGLVRAGHRQLDLLDDERLAQLVDGGGAERLNHQEFL